MADLDRLDEYEPLRISSATMLFFCLRCGAVVFGCAPHTDWHNRQEARNG